MFTPLPMIDQAVIKQGKTELSVSSAKSQRNGDRNDDSSSMSSHSWSHSSVYRHNPYGGTPTQIRTIEREVVSGGDAFGAPQLPRQASGGIYTSPVQAR